MAQPRLTPEQITSLEDVPGWTWNTWEENLARVQEFARLKGKLPSLKSDTEEERRLAHWCQRQRHLRNSAL